MSTLNYQGALHANATSFRPATAISAKSLLVAALLMEAAISVGGCSDKTAVPTIPVAAIAAPLPACEIVGFYGAANNGGTFVRTVEQAPVRVGDAILVTGTGLYDGNWTVLQKVRYQDARDPQPLWGYRIEPKWRGFPPGFINYGGVAVRNAAKLQPL